MDKSEVEPVLSGYLSYWPDGAPYEVMWSSDEERAWKALSFKRAVEVVELLAAGWKVHPVSIRNEAPGARGSMVRIGYLTPADIGDLRRGSNVILAGSGSPARGVSATIAVYVEPPAPFGIRSRTELDTALNSTVSTGSGKDVRHGR